MVGCLGLWAWLSWVPAPTTAFQLPIKPGSGLPRLPIEARRCGAAQLELTGRRIALSPLWAGQDGVDDEPGGKRRRPQIFNKLSALFLRLRTFIT